MKLNQQKIENYVKIESLKSETMGKLNSRFLISSLPSSALRRDVESLGKPRARCQQAFSKPCQVNLISKDTIGTAVAQW